MPRLDIIAGARPNFIKVAPIIRAIRQRQNAGSDLAFRLVHTGQHYGSQMSGNFFAQLGLPDPDLNLEAGSGTQAEQVATIMVRYEKALIRWLPDLCLVVGDVNSTMACSIVAQKSGVRVAHVEGGIRSGDWSMPEEINRLVTDAVSDYFFTTSTFANENLEKAGVCKSRIFFVGNTMIDTLLASADMMRPPPFWEEWGLTLKRYFVLTLHRPSNVDKVEYLDCLLQAIGLGCREAPVIFPAHPRTLKSLHHITNMPANIRIIDPQPYLEFNFLVKNAMAVITDSGGITEEATVMGVPCLTLRDTTERPETVLIGTNELVGSDPARLGPALDKLYAGEWKSSGIPEKWDGKSGERIVNILERMLANRAE